jgi:hypothetical protein
LEIRFDIRFSIRLSSRVASKQEHTSMMDDDVEQIGDVADESPDVAPPLTGKRVLTPEQREAKNAKARAKRAAAAASEQQEGATDVTAKKGAKAKAKAPRAAKPKKAKAVKPKNERKAANGNGAARGPRGEKSKEIVRLMQRKNGVTRAEVLEYTGWPALSFQAFAKSAGVRMRKEKVKGEPTRYFCS